MYVWLCMYTNKHWCASSPIVTRIYATINEMLATRENLEVPSSASVCISSGQPLHLQSNQLKIYTKRISAAFAIWEVCHNYIKIGIQMPCLSLISEKTSQMVQTCCQTLSFWTICELICIQWFQSSQPRPRSLHHPASPWSHWRSPNSPSCTPGMQLINLHDNCMSPAYSSLSLSLTQPKFMSITVTMSHNTLKER